MIDGGFFSELSSCILFNTSLSSFIIRTEQNIPKISNTLINKYIKTCTYMYDVYIIYVICYVNLEVTISTFFYVYTLKKLFALSK